MPKYLNSPNLVINSVVSCPMKLNRTQLQHCLVTIKKFKGRVIKMVKFVKLLQ